MFALGMLSACGQAMPTSFLLIEGEMTGACIMSPCKRAPVQPVATEIAALSDCSRARIFTSYDEWLIAKAPPEVTYWKLSLSQSYGPGPRQMTWLLIGSRKSYLGRGDPLLTEPLKIDRGGGDPQQIAKDVCAIAN